MTLRPTLFTLLSMIASVALTLAIPSASAAELTVNDPWVREAPPGAAAIAAYMVLENPGNTEQVLTAVSSPISDDVQIHRTIHSDGVARMEQQHSVSIPAGGQLAFESGGYHIMIMQPASLKAGDRVAFTLQLQDGSTVSVDAEVRRVMGADPHQHHHH